MLLHPQRAETVPRPASTLLLVRDRRDGGWEVLMTRRAATASAFPGMYVFPGGGLEAQDAQLHAQVLQRPDQCNEWLTAAIAAVRESWEEMGVLLAAHADGRPATQADVEALDRSNPLWPQLAERGLQLDVRGLWQLAHWTGDRGSAKRFAVPFWVCRMPQGQTPVADDQEQFEPVWVQPQQALERHAQGQMPMIFPTLRTLQRLQTYTDVAHLLAALAHGPLWRSSPRGGWLGGTERRYMENEAPYGELALVNPDGQILHHLDWQSTQAVPLRRNVLRLTAPNANVMTGPGTNSYVVGEAVTGYTVIDPGPADAAHVQRLWQATGGDVRHIVCTHSHADHAPGAPLLQALCVQHGQPRPLIYGLPSAATARPASYFVPDVVLADGQCLVLEPSGGADADVAAHRHTLRAVHTPGHAANHLCLLLREDALLFSGDHILNGSTTLVELPDGNMTDYLASLDKLAALCAAQQVEFILPAHGYVLGDALGVIARLKAHRLGREAKVLAALQARPQGSVRDWVAHAYADTPPALWPLAERSLRAHVERLCALGLAHVTD